MSIPFKWPALALLGLLAHSSDAAVVSMFGHDDVGISSFISAGNWDNGAAPSAGNDYFTGPFRLRSPATTLSYTFAGDSLTVHTSEGRLFGKSIADPVSPGQVLTINNLILDGGYVDQSGWSWLTLMGNIQVIAESSFGASSSDTLEIKSVISGSAPLNISGPTINSGQDTGAVILSSANPYSGTMTLCANTPANSEKGLLRLNHRDALASATLNTISSTLVALSFSSAANTGEFNIGALTGTGNIMLSDSVGMPVVLSVGGKGSSTTYSGSLAGSGGLTKVGSGTLRLLGANTNNRGNTTVEGGVLSLTVPHLYDESTVSIAASAVLQLDFAATDTVGALVLGGNAQPDGVYSSGNSGGFITGAGSLLVKTVVAGIGSSTPAPPVDSPYRSARAWRAYDGGAAPPASSFFDVPFMAVRTWYSAGALKIAGNGRTAAIYHSADDAAVVAIAAKALRDDVQRVTGLLPKVSTGVPIAVEAILIGTIGQSPLIDGLIAAGKLDVAAIEGKWEAYTAVVVDHPMLGVGRALIIAGSDRRGTAFGVFGLSESMGVSPWYWWGDVAVAQKSAIFVSGCHTQASPAVKYRGIFLNDEDWGLQPWAAQTFEPEVGNIGPKTYATIYELLLRLHSNMIWPAMHEWPVMTTPFYLVPGNKIMADNYGIVIGTSHHEPMHRNSHEYDESVLGSYNYWSNWDTVYRFWDERVEETADCENIYTVGMRGRTDAGMLAPSGTTDAQKAEKLQHVIIPDQREMLSRHVNSNASEMPQIFIPYKETLVQYQAGLQLPDDITILWPDDNHGYIRQLANASERARSGGSGIYYHLSYWGTPASYLWFCSTPPGMTRYEMLKAWDFEARNIWLVNVGDLKPAEIGTDFFLRMARNPEAFRNFDQHDYFTQWAARAFDPLHAEAIAEVLDGYFSLNIVKRPEHLTSQEVSGFSRVANGDEAQKRLDKFASLAALAGSIYGWLSAEQKPAFYEMVLYPVRASYKVNQRTLLAERSRMWAEQKRAATAALAAEAQAAHDAVMAEIQFYNEVNAGGKWNLMLNPMPELAGWARETQNPFLMPEVGSYPPPAPAALGVATEGSEAVLESGVPGELPVFNRAADSNRFFDIFNQGLAAMSWTAVASAPWVVLSETNGTADARIMVSINWDTAPHGNAVLGSVIIAAAGAEQTVSLVVYHPENLDLANLPAAVEDNKAVVIEAEDFVARTDRSDGAGWRRVDKATASQDGMAIEPITASSVDPASIPTNSPSLTYKFYAFTTGPVQIFTQCLPTHRLTSDHVGVRYAISLNGDSPIVVDVNAEEYTAAWNVNTLRAASVGVSDHKITAPGSQTIEVWMVDASVVLDKITVQLFLGIYLYEAEQLTVHDKSTDVQVTTYVDVPASAGGGMHIQSSKASQFATFVLPNIQAGDYEIIIRVKKWTSRGIMQLAVAETPTGLYTDIGAEQDLYSTSGGYSDLEAIPVKFVSDGTKYLRFTATGKNPSASNYWILFDTVFMSTTTVDPPSGP